MNYLEVKANEAYTATATGGKPNKSNLADIWGNVLASFEDRDTLVTAISNGDLDNSIDGNKVSVGNLIWVYEEDATAIPDMDDWLPLGDVRAEHFGAVGDGVTDDSAKLQAAINHCRNGSLHLGVNKTYLHNSQIYIHEDDNSSVSINLLGDNVTLESHVTGSVSGYDVDGFGILIDGGNGVRIGSGITVNFSNGTAGLVQRCRKASNLYNLLECSFAGGSVLADRETATKVSLRYIGNEASASSTGNACYYNTVKNAEFRFSYKHIEHIVGDGDNSTKQPNQNSDKNCKFSRYIIAIDWGDSDENTSLSAWANSASGAAGINGGFTDMYVGTGSLNFVSSMQIEVGAGGRPYNWSGSASKNTVQSVANTSVDGVDTSTAQDNVFIDKDKIVGLRYVNNFDWDVAGQGDVNFFGNGTASHGGTEYAKLTIGSRGGNADIATFGWQGSAVFGVGLPNGNALELSGDWQTPIKIGSIYMWEESTDIYVKKNTAPTSGTDGTVLIAL